VNKAFTPNVVNLGGSSLVTVTLQNNDTTVSAAISAFTDDVGTTMAGTAVVDSVSGASTTCGTGTPTITGNVVTMSNGTIPQAPSATVPGSCTITFHVFANKIGNGINTILQADVQTSLGEPPGAVSQTLNVQSANVVVSASASANTVVGATGTLTFTVTNPAVGVPLTNAGFSINGTSTQPFTVVSATSSCGGTVTTPATGTSGTISLALATIPANGACTVTVQTTSAVVSTVNYTLPAGSVTDDQGATDSVAASNAARFVVGNPNISKSFTPTAVLPGGTSQLKISIANILTAQSLSAAQIVDPLPGGITLDAAAPIYTSCGSPAIAGVGTGSITVSGATIPAATTCTIKVTVDVPATPGSLTNTIPAANFTSTEVTGAAGPASASLLITGPGGGISTGKGVAPGTVGPNTPVQFTLTFNSLAGGAMSAGSFSDNLPQAPQPMQAVNDASHLPTATNCGGAPVLTVTGGATSVSGTGLTISAGGTCTVQFYAQFTTPPPGVNRVDTNTLAAANVSFTDSFSNVVHPAQNVAANITELPVLTMTNYTASAQGLINQPLTVTGSVVDTTGTTDSNLTATFHLTAGEVQLAPSPNFVFGGTCPVGITAANITIGPSRESFSVNFGSGPINATCAIQYDVIDEGGVAGTFTAPNPTYTSSLSGGVSVAFTGTNAVTFASSNINITKAFAPNQIQAGATSTASVTVSVAGVAGFTQTQANGVAFSDALPANVTFASVPNVTFGAGCQVSGQPAPTSLITGSTISFSNISLLTVGTTTQPCTTGFTVTSSTLGAPVNQIPVHAVTSTSGIKNSQPVSASLTVASGVAIQKTYVSSTLQIGSTDYLRFLITNSATTSILSGGSVTDNMPAQLVLASTTQGPQLSGDPGLCPASFTSGSVGSSNFVLGNITVPGLVGSTPGQCVMYVSVRASLTAAPGIVSNTIGVGQLAIGGYANQTPSTGTNTLTSAPNVTSSKAFSPATIALGGTSTLTITVANTAAGSAPLSALALSDSLPANVTIAATPNASTTCGAGTVAAVAAGSTVALSNGTVAANATCMITVSVKSSTSGIWTNTIPASTVTTTQGATNGTPATAALNVGNVSGITLAKSFSPAAIAVNGTSTLTVTIANTAATAVALSSIGLTDSLPANVTIATLPNASTTCTGGATAANAGGTTVGLSGTSLAAGATCTFSVSVTSSVTGIYVNTIPASSFSDAQGSTNTAPAQATLNVGNSSGVGIAKTFTPAAIAANGASILTIALVNTSSNAIALSGMTLTDTLPTHMTIAAKPSAATTCGAGAVTAAAGGSTLTLGGGTLGANASCAISVAVTSAVAGIYLNTIPANALTDVQGSTNASIAQATLNVGNASVVLLAKSFSPTVIAPGGTSMLTISLANTSASAVALSTLALTDTLPTNVTVASTPSATTTCTFGTVTATAGGARIALSGASLAANATCTVTLAVTGTVAGAYTNTIPTNAITTAQGATNGSPAQATLTIGQPTLLVTKTSNPASASVSPGQTVTYTIVVKNGGTQAETNAHVSDTLVDATLVPGSVTINGAAAANAVITGGQAFGTIAIGASATITYSAVVNPNAATGAQVTNSATVGGDQPCTGASCTAASPPNTVIPPTLRATKLIDGQQSKAVLPGQTVTYSISVANTGASPAVNVAATDVVPAGLTVVAGTVTLNGATAAGATINGQTLRVPISTIAAGTSALVAFEATVGTTMGTVSNIVKVTALGLVRDVESTPAVAHAVPSTIALTKTATATTVSAGDRVDYSIVATPASGVAYGATTIVDMLPNYMVYAPGTARVDGKPHEPTVQGHTLTWTLASLTGAVTIAYATAIAPGAPQNGTLTNTATVTALAPGGAEPGRGSASASVLVVGSTFGSCYPITGRVYLDAQGSGRFEDPDVGLAAVHIFLDNGESVVTDSTGRYDFPCVHLGMHALRLDAKTLPTATVPYNDRNIDSEKSTRRLVHHTYDSMIIEDVNFAVTGTLAKPLHSDPEGNAPP
jgi:uncharacterized repeat protein (TIGR01451 family)/fimbrial isopeptide formation D2 family protein